MLFIALEIAVIIIRDVIICLENKISPELFMKMTFEQRQNHSKWINNQIDIITPNHSKIDNHCFNN